MKKGIKNCIDEISIYNENANNIQLSRIAPLFSNNDEMLEKLQTMMKCQKNYKP